MTELEHRPDRLPDRPADGFTRTEIELIKSTVASGTTDDELALFLKVAERRRLDPFAGEIHAVKRWDSRERREVMAIQVGIGGYRTIAERTGALEWVEGPEFTGDGETWTGAWLHDAPPAAARFTVKRLDRTRPTTRVVLWSEYAGRKRDGDLTPMWANLGVTMLGKVAEVHALRAAFSSETSGFYAPEEMDQAGFSQEATAEEVEEVATVDQPELRAELYERFRRWYGALDDDRRAEVWPEIGPRLKGDPSRGLRDAFAATPLHVLEELVATYVDDDGDTPAELEAPEPDGGDDETPEPVTDDAHEDDDATDAEIARAAGSDNADAVQAAATAIATGPLCRDGHRGPVDRVGIERERCRACGEEWATATEPDTPPAEDDTDTATLERYYPGLTVVEVGKLVDTGTVTIDDQGPLELRRPAGLDGLAEVHRLEGERDRYRETVRAKLASAGFEPGQEATTPTEPAAPAEDDDTSGDDPRPEANAPENASESVPAGDDEQADRDAEQIRRLGDREVTERRALVQRFRTMLDEVERHDPSALDELDAIKRRCVGSEFRGALYVEKDDVERMVTEAAEVHRRVVPF